ncbi:uncharacterized protein LOC107503482 isoform X3 [Rousettus aegyptiacus]|uniref:uncharacterized protein LOC107503482 isoform X3 n=1 Tax=Rousettus aegyptiacus TaxID=9407 RepID=UPI00168D2FF4|nr:uncharacterized protein LOC107503482 isoform X3 [Rousettus aegyptiacus]XP_036089148.1 uncharacterized protein LOC107503482 isoform X3 [Rousettus aegyptiacus]
MQPRSSQQCGIFWPLASRRCTGTRCCRATCRQLLSCWSWRWAQRQACLFHQLHQGVASFPNISDDLPLGARGEARGLVVQLADKQANKQPRPASPVQGHPELTCPRRPNSRIEAGIKQSSLRRVSSKQVDPDRTTTFSNSPFPQVHESVFPRRDEQGYFTLRGRDVPLDAAQAGGAVRSAEGPAARRPAVWYHTVCARVVARGLRSQSPKQRVFR